MDILLSRVYEIYSKSNKLSETQLRNRIGLGNQVFRDLLRLWQKSLTEWLIEGWDLRTDKFHFDIGINVKSNVWDMIGLKNATLQFWAYERKYNNSMIYMSFVNN
jgi:hypothetical protein